MTPQEPGGGHDHSHDHDHDHTHDHSRFGLPDHFVEMRGKSKRSLTIALVLIGGYMFVDVAGGIVSGSLGLIAHAGHLLSDTGAMALALIAMHFAGRSATATRTYGYHRLETLAALVSVISLSLIAGGILVEAVGRLGEVSEVDGAVMLSVGSAGLVVNIVAAKILHGSAAHNLNVEGVFRHIMADLLGSVGIVISGLLVVFLGWHIADPIVSICIGVLILASTWRLLVKVLHVLLEGTPKHIDVHALCHRIEALEGVTLIHDIHVWTLTPGYDAMTAHVLVDPDHKGDLEDLLGQARAIASDDFGIHHITIQVETSLGGCTEDHHVDHLLAEAG